ncbi:hypothetical protein IWQ60_003355 [Tieghemiomyces parasiticus]|uniref:Uncharacterized protein n=1 Tax=Tieghemiomyces parasiticus TaxID=78921 RepID=A0A9W8AAZ6_9FUNG|nr:hypothetical protein IWQ60_003355 [Tieghemiomyces parasiticus]
MDDFFIHPVEQKVSCAQWYAPSTYVSEELHFLTGTWDEGTENALTLWRCPAPDARTRQLNAGFTATALCRTPHTGDVASIALLQPHLCATASSNGQLYLYALPDDLAAPDSDRTASYELKLVRSWDTAAGEPNARAMSVDSSATAVTPSDRGLRSPCTAVAVQPHKQGDPELAVVGENGHLNIFTAERTTAIDTTQADCLPLYDVAWLTSNTLMTASRSGQLKLFDRRDMREAVAVLMDPVDTGAAVNCIAVHASQTNRIAVGNALGRAQIWDLRQYDEPQSQSIPLHHAEITDIRLHPHQPFTVATASADGSCVMMDTTAVPTAPGVPPTAEPLAHRRYSAMASGRTASSQGILKLQNLYNRLSINCLDFHPQNGLMLAGSDNENLLFHLD